MVNFCHSKIYQITSPQSDKIYIGSTAKKYLSARLGSHCSHMNRLARGVGKTYITSFEILKFKDAKILLLESLPACKSRDELRAREQDWITANKPICVNQINAVQPPDAFEKYMKIVTICGGCGISYSNRNKARHLKTSRHIRKTAEREQARIDAEEYDRKMNH
jgi:hypothetical protein